MLLSAVLTGLFAVSQAVTFGRPSAFVSRPQWGKIGKSIAVRGGADEQQDEALEPSVDVDQLYLPGLLDTVVEKTKVVSTGGESCKLMSKFSSSPSRRRPTRK